MPIVVKLSQAFYDRFGDEVVGELVGMLNQVDAASQNSLRELNEANFARFDDRLERRFSQLEALLERRLGEQARWLHLSWATLMAAIVALWFRH
jgi:DNA anti-recombination protein RmuC